MIYLQNHWEAFLSWKITNLSATNTFKIASKIGTAELNPFLETFGGATDFSAGQRGGPPIVDVN